MQPIRAKALSDVDLAVYYQDFQFMFDEYLKVIQEYDFFEKYQREYFAVLEGADQGT